MIGASEKEQPYCLTHQPIGAGFSLDGPGPNHINLTARYEYGCPPEAHSLTQLIISNESDDTTSINEYRVQIWTNGNEISHYHFILSSQFQGVKESIYQSIKELTQIPAKDLLPPHLQALVHRLLREIKQTTQCFDLFITPEHVGWMFNYQDILFLDDQGLIVNKDFVRDHLLIVNGEETIYGNIVNDPVIYSQQDPNKPYSFFETPFALLSLDEFNRNLPYKYHVVAGLWVDNKTKFKNTEINSSVWRLLTKSQLEWGPAISKIRQTINPYIRLVLE